MNKVSVKLHFLSAKIRELDCFGRSVADDRTTALLRVWHAHIVIYTTGAHLPALLHSTRLIGIKHESEGRVTLLLIELNAKLAYVHEFCR